MKSWGAGRRRRSAPLRMKVRRTRDTCRHDNADHLMPGECCADMDGAYMGVALVEQLRCLDCQAWLSLGKSNDEPRQVRMEIRSAATTLRKAH